MLNPSKVCKFPNNKLELRPEIRCSESKNPPEKLTDYSDVDRILMITNEMNTEEINLPSTFRSINPYVSNSKP